MEQIASGATVFVSDCDIVQQISALITSAKDIT